MTDSSKSLSRREMIQTTTAAVTGSLAMAGAATGCSARAAEPQFFSPEEFALLDELTDLIIPTDGQSPGARAAAVAGYIDGRLAESLDADWQARWRAGLEAVNVLSREVAGKPLLDATPEERVAVVSRMAAGEADPQAPPEPFFRELKRWTVRGYYTSKMGLHVDQQYKGNVAQPGEYAGFDAT